MMMRVILALMVVGCAVHALPSKNRLTQLLNNKNLLNRVIEDLQILKKEEQREYEDPVAEYGETLEELKKLMDDNHCDAPHDQVQAAMDSTTSPSNEEFMAVLQNMHENVRHTVFHPMYKDSEVDDLQYWKELSVHYLCQYVPIHAVMQRAFMFGLHGEHCEGPHFEYKPKVDSCELMFKEMERLHEKIVLMVQYVTSSDDVLDDASTEDICEGAKQLDDDTQSLYFNIMWAEQHCGGSQGSNTRNIANNKK